VGECFKSSPGSIVLNKVYFKCMGLNCDEGSVYVLFKQNQIY
jgi:hypothetical protein